jgi:hypothetical protein
LRQSLTTLAFELCAAPAAYIDTQAVEMNEGICIRMKKKELIAYA